MLVQLLLAKNHMYRTADKSWRIANPSAYDRNMSKGLDLIGYAAKRIWCRGNLKPVLFWLLVWRVQIKAQLAEAIIPLMCQLFWRKSWETCRSLGNSTSSHSLFQDERHLTGKYTESILSMIVRSTITLLIVLLLSDMLCFHNYLKRIECEAIDASPTCRFELTLLLDADRCAAEQPLIKCLAIAIFKQSSLHFFSDLLVRLAIVKRSHTRSKIIFFLPRRVTVLSYCLCILWQ